MTSQGLPNGGRVAEVEVAELVDCHPVVQGGGCDVDSFRYLGVEMAEELRAE
jgi:hypothetical protein